MGPAPTPIAAPGAGPVRSVAWAVGTFDPVQLRLTSRQDYCIDIPGGNTEVGTQIIMWDCHGGENQIFRWGLDGLIRVSSGGVERCLAVGGNGQDSGSPIVLASCNGAQNQRWELGNSAAGVRLASANVCLDVPPGQLQGMGVIAWECHGDANQRWTASPAPGTSQPTLRDGAINQNDSYLAVDMIVSDTTLYQDQAGFVDPVSGNFTTSIRLAPKPQRFHVEIGYADDGSVRQSLYRLDPLDADDDPNAQVARAVVSYGGLTTYEVHGAPLTHLGDLPDTAAYIADDPDGYPDAMSTVGELSNVNITYGVLLAQNDTSRVGFDPVSAPEASSGAARGASAAPGEAEFMLGRPTIERPQDDVIRLVQTLDAGGPAAGRLAVGRQPDHETRRTGRHVRTYRRQNGRFAMEETRAELTRELTEGRRTTYARATRLANLRWHINAANDARRDSTRAAGPAPGAAPGTPGIPARIGVRRAASTGGWAARAGLGAFAQVPGATPMAGECLPESVNYPGGANVVLQHGISSDQCTWSRMHPYVVNRYHVQHVVTPSLASTTYLDGQVSELSQKLEATRVGRTGYIFVGHSQGGLISRRYAQTLQTNSRSEMVRGVVTLNTPHQGAPIARQGRQWILNASVTAVIAFSNCGVFGLQGCDWANRYVQSGVGGVVANLAYNELTGQAKVDLRPGSAFLNQLNAYPESFARFGIEGRSSSRWQPFRLFGDVTCAPDAWCGGRAAAARADRNFYGNIVCGFLNLFTQNYNGAWACGWRAGSLLAFDEGWKLFYSGFERAGDGIVPASSQRYPGAQQFTVENADSHVGATKSPLSRDQLRFVFESRLGVGVKNAGYQWPAVATAPPPGVRW